MESGSRQAGRRPARERVTKERTPGRASVDVAVPEKGIGGKLQGAGLFRQAKRTLPFFPAQQNHPRPHAGAVADQADLFQREGRDQPDSLGALQGDRLPKTAGNHQVVQVLHLQAGMVEQGQHAGTDGRLGQLHRPDVLLAEENLLCQADGWLPVPFRHGPQQGMPLLLEKAGVVDAPQSSSAATAAIRPEPQIPTAGFRPMVRQRREPSVTQTRSMAPGAAFIPWEIPAPSKAGPAAVEQQRISSPRSRAISPLVPMSTSRRSPGGDTRPPGWRW